MIPAIYNERRLGQLPLPVVVVPIAVEEEVNVDDARPNGPNNIDHVFERELPLPVVAIPDAIEVEGNVVDAQPNGPVNNIDDVLDRDLPGVAVANRVNEEMNVVYVQPNGAAVKLQMP